MRQLHLAVHGPESPPIASLLASLCVVAVTTGSQWGMLYLSYVYASQGRSVSIGMTPELVLGTLAMIFAVMAAAITRIRFLTSKGNWAVSLPLFLFVLLAIVSELFQRDIQWRSLMSTLSLWIYFVVGGICGHVLYGRDLRRTAFILLGVFSGWYVGLLALGMDGLLSYDSRLAGATIARLEVVGGFTATEIPIYIGMQLPFLLMVVFGPFGAVAKTTGYVLLCAAGVVLYMTASAGAIVAACLVLGIFLIYGSRETKKRAWFFIAGITTIVVVFGGFYFTELFSSVSEKLDILDSGGGRAESNALLVAVAADNAWIGIGRGRFQEINHLGWFQQGIYPHHNILGIAAEMGIPAAMFYVAFVVLSVLYLIAYIRRCKRDKSEKAALLLTATLGVLVYQQARGLLHDTWTFKELYFWVGFGFAVISVVAYERRRISKLKLSPYHPYPRSAGSPSTPGDTLGAGA